MGIANVYARIQNTKSTGVLKSNYVKTPVWHSLRRFAFSPIHIYLWKVKVSPPERSEAAEEIPQVLACQPLQRTEGEPLGSRLIGTKLETFKIPFLLIGEGKEGKVSRATFLGLNMFLINCGPALYTFCAAVNLKYILGCGPESFWIRKKNYLVNEV